MNNFLGEGNCRGRGIFAAYREKHDESVCDLAGNGAIDAYACAAHALNDGSHPRDSTPRMALTQIVESSHTGLAPYE